eukprot:TRINITY_DN8762_c0_g3_i1.p1 TRINITY_DN8762_c0_g3~~TRINITY_DN8762_c0_g3_i1.p1  ORF type:complete len:438 (-),score=60.37 TRINITY_DN8762_c0_g3_i1:243-1556(-)
MCCCLNAAREVSSRLRGRLRCPALLASRSLRASRSLSTVTGAAETMATAGRAQSGELTGKEEHADKSLMTAAPAASRIPKDGKFAMLPRTLALLLADVEDGLHLGAQVAVARLGCPDDVIDIVVGWRDVQRQRPMCSTDLLPWSSTVKPVMAIALAQLSERGLLRLDDAVCKHVPEFAAKGKSGVTLLQVLLHTAGFPYAGLGLHQPSQASILQACIDADLEWVPGSRCSYHLHGWTLLAEVIRRVDGRCYSQYVREEIFCPLKMQDCFVGMSMQECTSYRERLAPLFTRRRGGTWYALADHDEDPREGDPGGGGCGPAAQLVRLFAALRPGSALGLSEETLRYLREPLRRGLVDELQGAAMDWSCLGVVGKVSLTGKHASAEAFAHGGSQSSCLWCDPISGWCCAVICNGKPGTAENYARMDKLATAVAEDVADLN